MSEEILKALTQLFALIAKQDDGITPDERAYVEGFFKRQLDFSRIKEYMELFDEYLTQKRKKRVRKVKDVVSEGQVSIEKEAQKKVQKDTRVNESVRILGICKKINKTLSQKQKIVVLFRILELVAQDGINSSNKMEIVETVASVFKFEKQEYEGIKSFVFNDDPQEMKNANILIVDGNETNEHEGVPQVQLHINGHMLFIFVESVEMYFVKYIGGDAMVMNGFMMNHKYIYLFSSGSTIKAPSGDVLFFSDLIRNFYSDFENIKLSFKADNISYRFPNGNLGLRNITINEGPGSLIGIMGSSGAGKTTLLNCLAGLIPPTENTVEINGFDIYKEAREIEGLIGYVAQDDLLMSDLTVYENLYYNAKLCFGGMSKKDLNERVLKILKSLGLEEPKDLKVGSPLDKTISGGQRKRLNIALELIREPAVLFVDEPTSGLSSRDSENVIDLLKELSLKGKLVYAVIHQPSSDIYKMFDTMIILDTGGYQIYYGNPVEAVTWFKSATNQVDSDRGQCSNCGNVNPEQIFNIIEAQVVDEYGRYTGVRKQTPKDWTAVYTEKNTLPQVETVNKKPPTTLKLPSLFKQLEVFIKRDVIAKMRNRQYLVINFLQAPFLAAVLAFLIRYQNTEDEAGYYFRFNENIPAFIMMAIIVALFMGLSVSAEEIIKDRLIRKRESFLNLSLGSYLASKVFILFVLSAVQTFTFVLVGSLILEIKGMFLGYWAVLFSTACFANILGLNASSMMKSAVNVYILIPLLLIPQMILSGLLFSFDKLNDSISNDIQVPIVADLMTSRWAYEAIAVNQYTNNPYQRIIYKQEVKEKNADYKTTYLIKELDKDISYMINNPDSVETIDYKHAKARLINSLQEEILYFPMEDKSVIETLKNGPLTVKIKTIIDEYLLKMKDHYLKIMVSASNIRNEMQRQLAERSQKYEIRTMKNKYFNESLGELLRNLTSDKRIIKGDTKYFQNVENVYNVPDKPSNPLNYRAHFFAPKKWLFGKTWNTFGFNIAVIWAMILLLLIALYFEIFKKMMQKIGG